MDDENEHNVTSIITVDEFLKIGLKLVLGYTKCQIRRCKHPPTVCLVEYCNDEEKARLEGFFTSASPYIIGSNTKAASAA